MDRAFKTLFHVSQVNITYCKNEKRFAINSILIFTVFSAENTVHMNELTKKIYLSFLSFLYLI